MSYRGVVSLMGCTVLLGLCSGTRSGAQSSANVHDVTIVAPVFGQVMGYQVPVRFDLTHPEQSNQRFYLHELVLKGETVDHWTEMITATGTANVAMAPEDALVRAAEGFRRACPTTFFEKRLPAANAFMATAVLECGQLAEQGQTMHSEATLYVVLQGSHAEYTFQWAKRGKPTAADLTQNTAAWQAMLAALRPRLCAIPADRQPALNC